MQFKLLSLLTLVAPISALLQYSGADWSSVMVTEAAGVKYKTASGVVTPLETILKQSGANTVRQRLWVNPSGGTYGLQYNLQLAARAKKAGLQVYLDMHFSDTWADPGHQTTPAGWPTNIDDLAWELYNYTLAVGQSFQAAGIQPVIISIGNEITAGMLWPLGSNSNNFVNLARLLHSASSGIRDSGLNPQPKIMTHLDNGWDWGTQQWWYENVLAEGTFFLSDFDAIGLSYYPFYNSAATLASMTQSLSNLAATYPGKSLIVAETNWPESCPNPAIKFPSDTSSIPISAAGQTTWTEDVASLLEKTSGGAGLFYWEPAWIGNAGLGSSCADNLFVDSTGTVRTSMSVFAAI